MTETTNNTPSKTTGAGNARTHYEWTEDGRRVLIPGVTTRMDRVVSWIGWHSPEMAGVLVPGVFAFAVTPWLWLVSAAVAVGWTVHEVRIRKEQAAIKAGRALPAAPAEPAEKSGEEA